MLVESPAHLEQDPAQIDEIRKGIRDLYDLPEVEKAVWDAFCGRVSEYEMERFRKDGTVIIRRAPFAYQFYSRDEGQLGPDYSRLKLKRFNNLQEDGSYSQEGSYEVDASSPYRIRVIEYNSWPWDRNKRVLDDPETYIVGQQALNIAREVITSYNQQRFPLQHPQNQ